MGGEKYISVVLMWSKNNSDQAPSAAVVMASRYDDAVKGAGDDLAAARGRDTKMLNRQAHDGRACVRVNDCGVDWSEDW